MTPLAVTPPAVTVPPLRNASAFVTVGWMHGSDAFARLSFAASSCAARQLMRSPALEDEQFALRTARAPAKVVTA